MVSYRFSHLPYAFSDTSGKDVVSYSIVEYHFDYCIVWQSLRNHHESLLRSGDCCVWSSRSRLIQCLREVFRIANMTPRVSFEVINSCRVHTFKCNAFYSACFHVAAAYEFYCRQSMAEPQINSRIGSTVDFFRSCHQ